MLLKIVLIIGSVGCCVGQSGSDNANTIAPSQECSCNSQINEIQENDRLLNETIERLLIEVLEDAEEDDPCKPNPCDNGGSCFSSDGEYLCKCSDGYDEINCTRRIECIVSAPPKYGSISSDAAKIPFEGTITYRCHDRAGFIGHQSTTLTATCQKDRNWSIERPSCNVYCAGVIYEDECIKLPYTRGDPDPITFDEAVSVCEESGGRLADVYSDDMYDAVYDYVYRTWKAANRRAYGLYVWLASTYNPFDVGSDIILTNGTKIVLNRWKHRYPRGISISNYYSSAIHLVMTVQLIEGFGFRGISNSIGTVIDASAPICSYAL